MITTVKLYGHLGRRFGREFCFDIATVGEAVRALNANLTGFNAYLTNHSEPGYRVLVDDGPVLSVAELGLAVNVPRTIKIVPVVAGAAEGKSIGMIILGVVLVAAAFFTAGTSLLGLSVATTNIIASAAAGMGLSMIAGGVSQLLSPTPSMDEPKRSDNASFGDGVDTIRQGLAVPVVYGTVLCQGLPISVRLVVENESV